MGIDSLTQQNMQNAGLAGIDRLASNAMFPQSQMDKTQYSVSSQLPTGAQTIDADYDTPTNSYTGLATKPFAAGGIATLRYNGEEDGSQVQAWDPASGQVKLQQINPQDLSVAKTADYTIPKDDIQTFIPDTDTETGLSTGSGSYILNNGSKMRVDSTGTVIDATPARDEYTLNKDGYYQPTGSGLTWDGSAGMLTKKIGGIDVQVPGMFTKGGYQDEQGGLRLDQYGVPIPLPPAQYDSGAGKSGLSDAAPYIAMATLAAMGMPVEGMAFEGMVPASETLAGGFGTGATTSGGFGLNTVGTGGGIIPPSAGYTYGGVSAGALGTGVPASLTVPTTGALAGNAAAGDFSAKQAYAAKMALDMLNSGAKTGGGQSYAAPQVSAAPTIPTVNRFGVTGYEGQAPTTETIFKPISTSKIRGAPGEYTFAEGGIANLNSYANGDQTESENMFENLTAKDKALLRLDLMAQSLKPMPGSEYTGSQYTPQGAFGRVGASTEIDDNAKIRAGLSGMAMAAPGQNGIKTMPGSMDVGYNTQVGPGNLDLSAFRSINPVPGRGHMQGVNAKYSIPFAQGGNVEYSLGSYSDGGQLLKGPGDGMSDNIPAKIGDAQPARLADGEFVVPADVVSHLGNGSTDAGAKQLYAMMDKIRKARTGNKKQGKQINPSKFLP